MPPRKPKSTVRAEDALAERILLERERREMSPAALADWMTRAGCPMTQSAIWKIENGNPRRRITFDEAVAFAKVFGMTVQELAQPPEVVHADRATDLVAQLRQDAQTRLTLQDRWWRSIEEIGELISEDPTGLVCNAVNVARLSPDEILVDGSDFDIDTWRALTPRLRAVFAERWKDKCVQEDALLRVKLAADDVPFYSRVATVRDEHEGASIEDAEVVLAVRDAHGEPLRSSDG